MRKITQAISAVCLLFALNSSAVALASSPSPLNPGTNVARLAEQAPIHWVSVAQIEPRFYVSTSKSIIKALINMHSFEIQLSPIG